MIAGGERMTSELFEQALRLRVIARAGVGYDLIDLSAATSHRVAVTITPGTNQESVAEQTLALILALARRIVVNDRIIHAGGWDRQLVNPVRGKTLGLIGMGRIGRAVAVRAQAFRMRLVAFDTVFDAEFDHRHGIERLSLDELVACSDMVSLHVPLTDATRGMVESGLPGQDASRFVLDKHVPWRTDRGVRLARRSRLGPSRRSRAGRPQSRATRTGQPAPGSPQRHSVPTHCRHRHRIDARDGRAGLRARSSSFPATNGRRTASSIRNFVRAGLGERLVRNPSDDRKCRVEPDSVRPLPDGEPCRRSAFPRPHTVCGHEEIADLDTRFQHPLEGRAFRPGMNCRSRRTSPRWGY